MFILSLLLAFNYKLSPKNPWYEDLFTLTLNERKIFHEKVESALKGFSKAVIETHRGALSAKISFPVS
jgi:hypothetical protein